MMDRFMIPAERTDLYDPNNIAVEESDSLELDPELFEIEE
jgi:hypothetical protein